MWEFDKVPKQSVLIHLSKQDFYSIVVSSQWKR